MLHKNNLNYYDYYYYTVAGSILGSAVGSERMNPLAGDAPVVSPLTYSLKQKRTSLTEEARSACCCSPFKASAVGWLTVEEHGTEARCCDKSGILDLCPAMVVKVVASVGGEVAEEEEEEEVEEVLMMADVATGEASASCSVSVRRQSGLMLLLSRVSPASTGSVSRPLLGEALGIDIDRVSTLALLAGGEAGSEGGLARTDAT